MLICIDENCSCFWHRLLNCLRNGLNEETRLILQSLENLCDVADSFGLSLLHYSVKYDNIEMSQYLISKGCNINAQDLAGFTPLALTAKNRNLILTELLLKNEVDIYVITLDGKSILELAFYSLFISAFSLDQNSRRIMEILLHKVNGDFLKGKDTVEKKLLGANNLSKLVIVVFGSEHLIRFIIENGYPIDFVDDTFGYTALHCAVIGARYESAKILIENVASINILDKIGYSPLRYHPFHFVDLDEKMEVFDILFTKSIYLSAPGAHGFTDVNYLLHVGNKKIVKKILLSGIDDVDTCLNGSLMSHVIRNNNQDVVDVFTELNIEFKINGDIEKSYLTLAARRGCPKLVLFLLDHGADVNFVSAFGRPLTNATIRSRGALRRRNPGNDTISYVQVTEFLLEYGADAQLRLNKEYTFIDYLCKYHQKQNYTKTIVTHLAMLGTLEPPALTALTRETIESGPLKSHFDFCVQQLEELNHIQVYGTVTIFKLLTERNYKLVAYARNSELISAFNSTKDERLHLESYYFNRLERRVSKAINYAKLQEQVLPVVTALTGFCVSVHHFIVYKIINYLDEQDLNKLCKIGNSLFNII